MRNDGVRTKTKKGKSCFGLAFVIGPATPGLILFDPADWSHRHESSKMKKKKSPATLPLI